MYYRNGTVSEIEDLVMEFLEYRKSKRAPEYIMQSGQAVKGWPQFKEWEPPQLPQLPQPAQAAIDGMWKKPSYDVHSEYLCSEISEKLAPFVTRVIDEVEHEGSCDYADKGKIAHIVDRSIDMAIEKLCELENLDEDAEHNEWSRYGLLRALVELLVLAEIHFNKKATLY